jgi:hypothetical protein
MKLVLVEWLDSHAGDGWQSIGDIAEACQPLHCRSVGWLVSESNDCKTLVPHLAGDKSGKVLSQGSGDLTIPNRSILRVRVLRTSR